jgi:hypothetical protein
MRSKNTSKSSIIINYLLDFFGKTLRIANSVIKSIKIMCAIIVRLFIVKVEFIFFSCLTVLKIFIIAKRVINVLTILKTVQRMFVASDIFIPVVAYQMLNS